MKAKTTLSCVMLCLIAAIAAFCSIQGVSGERVARAEAPAPASVEQVVVVEAEDCFLTPTETCWTEGAWITWVTPEASGGMLIDNENPPGSEIPVPVTLTLEFEGTGVGVVYRQDIWYGKLGVEIDQQLNYCTSQKGLVEHQAEACFEVARAVTHTLVLTGGPETGVITLDAIRIFNLAEPCGTRDSLCDRSIIVPAYFEPDLSDGDWPRLIAAARRLGKRLIVVANVNNGPGEEDPGHTEVISAVVNNGGRVLGYVYTCFGNEPDLTRPWCPRPEGEIERDVDRWFDWYGDDGLEGIFFDEVAITQDKVPFYQGLYDYVQAKETGATVVFNFGTEPHEDYGGIGSSILCTFEDPFSSFAGWLPPDCSARWSAPTWITRERSCVLVYDTPHDDLGAALEHLSRTEAGWFYFTDDTMVDQNPWDTLPPYFEELVDRIVRCTYLPVALNGDQENDLCGISIDPGAPTEEDAIEVTVFGVWNDSCIPTYGSHEVIGPVVRVDLLYDYPPDVVCLQVISPWRYPVDIGPLASGIYQILAYINGVPCGTKSFQVVSR